MVARAAMAKARAKSCLIEIISVVIGATKCDHGAAIQTFRIVCELFLLEVGRYKQLHVPLIDCWTPFGVIPQGRQDGPDRNRPVTLPPCLPYRHPPRQSSVRCPVMDAEEPWPRPTAHASTHRTPRLS